MEESILQSEALSAAEKNLQAYFESLDLNCVAEDAVYRNLNNGQVHKGRAEIGAMLHYVYQVAFDAHFERTTSVITEDHAVTEGFFIGRHIGEFEGIPATNKEVSVPLCVT